MDFSINDLALASLCIAAFGVTGLTWLLTKIESTFGNLRARATGQTENTSSDGSPEVKKAEPPRSSPRSVLLSSILLFLGLVCISLLFTANITHANQVIVSRRVIVASVIVALILSGIAGWKLFPNLQPFEMRMLGIAPIKEAVAITGTIFALFAGKVAVLSLSKSTNSNMAAVYGQIYRNDRDVADSEAANAQLMRLYVGNELAFMPGNTANERRPLEKADFSDPARVAKAYWRHRLALYLNEHPDNTTGLKSAEIAASLTDVAALTVYLESASGTNSPNDQLGHAFLHITNVFNNMHQVYDYGSRGVIPLGDAETWLGYFEDFGPHPVVLAGIGNWLDRGYMTRPFYAIAEFRLSGKRELFAFLEKCQADPVAIKLARELDANGVPKHGPKKDYKPLCPEFFPRMAQLVAEKAPSLEIEPNNLYLALTHAAVFDQFVVGKSDYSELVNDLVADVNDRELETIDSVPKRLRAR